MPGLATFDGKGGCRTCHQTNLAGIGLKSAEQLRSAVVNPGQQPMVTVKTKDGREYRGLRRNNDTFSVQILDANGQLRSFAKSQLVSIGVDATSIMPSDYARTG